MTEEHGHALLLKFISLEPTFKGKGKVIVEIGSTRELTMPGQNSTEKLADFAAKGGHHFVTVDANPECTAQAREMFARKGYSTFEAICERGEEYLKRCPYTIDALYLDAFDYYHTSHSEKRKSDYRKYLSTTITNEECWKMHLECGKAVLDKMGGPICIDDVLNERNDGKGKTLIPFLESKRWYVKERGYGAAILFKA